MTKTMKDQVIDGRKVFGEVCLRKQRRKRQSLLIKDLAEDYANNSTLHGLRYVTKARLTVVERCFWIATFILSVGLCSHQIVKVYNKWQRSPVIVTVSERFVSAGEVPLPSITICPQIKSMASVYNYSLEHERYYRTMNETEATKLADVAMLCISPFRILDRKFSNSSIINSIREVSPTHDDVFWICDWHENFMDVTDFSTVYTKEGLCYNFNSLGAEDMFRDTVQTDYMYIDSKEAIRGWSITDGYTAFDNTVFPKRGSENLAQPDLRVILQSSDKDKDINCNGLASGYKIYIQHPTDFPQSSMYYYAAVHGQLSSLAISFNQIRTSDALEDITADERQCVFPKDKQLHYFKIYTLKNCRAECLSNYTYKMCKCVGYYMPHKNSSEICADGKVRCMEEAQNTMASREIELELAKRMDGCNCLPACNTIEYEAEILKTDFNLKDYLAKHEYSKTLEEDTSIRYSMIEMYFKKPRFVSMRRSELFGLTEFLANIGGLLGVFLGFSFLSLIEIVYFLTLRVGFSLKRDLKDERKSQSVKLKYNKY